MEDISANIYKNIKHLTRLPLALNHLGNHKFKYSFLNSLNSICICSLDTETTSRFILHYPNFINDRTLLLSNASRLTKDKLPSCNTWHHIYLSIYLYYIYTSPLWWWLFRFGDKHSNIKFFCWLHFIK